MATGYSTAVLTDDTKLISERPALNKLLRGEETTYEVYRQRAFEFIQRKLLTSVSQPTNNLTYLNRVVDNTQLENLEVYKALQFIYESRTDVGNSSSLQIAEIYKAKFNEEWANTRIRWDESIDVTEEDNVVNKPFIIRLRRA